MSLKDYAPRRVDVLLPDDAGAISVRGVSAEDLGVMFGIYGDDLRALFDKFTADAPAGQDFDFGQVVGQIASEMPRLAALVIALAADESDSVDQARKLPLNVTVEALEKIGGLTFQREGDLKNFFEAVIRIMNGVSGSLDTVSGVQPSTIGIEGSEA